MVKFIEHRGVFVNRFGIAKRDPALLRLRSDVGEDGKVSHARLVDWSSG